ncbi:MAG: hypothetical protein AAGJ83_04455 [Planctomycetota bacterium]
MRAIRKVLRYFVPFAVVFCAKFVFVVADELTAEKRPVADPISWLDSDPSRSRVSEAVFGMPTLPSLFSETQQCQQADDRENLAWQFAEPCGQPSHE